MTPDERAALRAIRDNIAAGIKPRAAVADDRDVLLLLRALDAETARADATETDLRIEKAGRASDNAQNGQAYSLLHRSFTAAAEERDEARAEVERLRTLLAETRNEVVDESLERDEALDNVEWLVRQHCYQEEDGSYDTSALSTNRDAFDLLVKMGRAEYVGEQVGRRAFIRFLEGGSS